MNPTIDQVIKAVGLCTDLTYFGPGFQSKQILDEGLDKFIVSQEPFDYLFTDGVILFFKNSKPFATSLNYFSLKGIEVIIDDMRDYFIKSKGRKLFYPAIDYYNVSEEDINLLKNSNSYLLTWGIEFHDAVADCPLWVLESNMQKPNDLWIEFLRANVEHVISTPQIIAESEFNFAPCQGRKFDISIPGAPYYHRRMARKELKKLGRNYRIGRSNQGLLQKIWNQLFKMNNRYAFNLNKTNFEGNLENSKIIFTCGGTLNYPIRKFLEAPAKGSMLIFFPFKGHQNFGFKDKENCIITENVSDLNSKVKFYLSNGILMDRIARSGQKLIWEKHTIERRAGQISKCLDLISKESFRGSEWKDGEFICRS
jgi:hypothetical protein